MSDKNTCGVDHGRRELLALAGGAMALTITGALFPGRTFATPAEAAKLIEKITGGAKVQSSKVNLTLPEIAENGSTVPVTVTVDHPMTESDYVEAIHLIAEGNPAPDVASLHLTPANGKAEAYLRMRLSKTQNVVAIAKTNDGRYYMGQKAIKVTIGGCGG